MPIASVIIPAAGLGRRFAAEAGASGAEAAPTKVFAMLGGRPILARTVGRFLPIANVGEVVVAAPPGRADEAREACGVAGADAARLVVVEGGPERPESVARALEASDASTELVAIHDAVRPLIRGALIEEAFRTAVEHGAAVVGRPVDHTIKRIEGGTRVAQTVPRADLWLAQTPQVFRREIILQAYARRDQLVGYITDDAQLVEALGHPVVMVRGDAANFKVTTPEDLRLCEALLAAGWPFET
jgi:2-C-methyl-D-erythritol 4-phosphate cytidylyltransferase